MDVHENSQIEEEDNDATREGGGVLRGGDAFSFLLLDNSHLLFHSSFLRSPDDGCDDARPSVPSVTRTLPTAWATTTTFSARGRYRMGSRRRRTPCWRKRQCRPLFHSSFPAWATTTAPSARGRCQKIVGLPSLPAVSVFGGDGACRADALPAEEDDAVLAEDDGREKK